MNFSAPLIFFFSTYPALDPRRAAVEHVGEAAERIDFLSWASARYGLRFN